MNMCSNCVLNMRTVSRNVSNHGNDTRHLEKNVMLPFWRIGKAEISTIKTLEKNICPLLLTGQLPPPKKNVAFCTSKSWTGRNGDMASFLYIPQYQLLQNELIITKKTGPKRSK